MFCGTGKATKEHVFGKWWLKYYPIENNDHKKRFPHKTKVTSLVDDEEYADGKFSNVGAPLSTTTKVLCKECNSEWGSGIETQMEDVFVSTFKKRRKLTQRRAVAAKNWLFLKTCLQMRAYETPISLPNTNNRNVQQFDSKKILSRLWNHETWSKFRTNNRIPHEYRFFICRGIEPLHIGGVNYVPFEKFYLNDKRILSVKKYHTCLFTIGEFLGVVTNVSEVAKLLSNARDKFTSQKPFIELDRRIPPWALVSGVRFGEMEQQIMQKLEQTYKIKLKTISQSGSFAPFPIK